MRGERKTGREEDRKRGAGREGQTATPFTLILLQDIVILALLFISYCY